MLWGPQHLIVETFVLMIIKQLKAIKAHQLQIKKAGKITD